MTIILLAEGATETELKRHLKRFLDEQAEKANRPLVRLHSAKIEPLTKLQRQVMLQLEKPDVEAVIGLIDVFPNYPSAQAAKAALQKAVGHDPRFIPHAAQFDVEAWLLPYPAQLRKLIGRAKIPAFPTPETVNHLKPPSYLLNELCHLEKKNYSKPERLGFVLRDQDLTVAAHACPELKELLNTLLKLSRLPLLP